MRLSRSIILFPHLLVLATTQVPPSKDGLTLFLESAMKGFPQWLQNTLGDQPLDSKTVDIYENDGYIELTGEIRDLALNGYMEQVVTVQADFVRRYADVSVHFPANLELTGNYSLQGQVLNKSVSGDGVFRLRTFEHSDNSFVSSYLSNFGITHDGRINLDTAYTHQFAQVFDQSFPEFEGLESGGYSKHIVRFIKSYFVKPLEQLLTAHLKTYVRSTLENVSVSKILQDTYDGNLNNSFIDTE